MRTMRNRSFRPEISGLEGRQLLAMVGSPKAPVAPAPAVTTFGDTSNAAPALVEFGGKTLLVWSSSFDGALNVATVANGQTGYQLQSKVTLVGDTSNNLTPAATVFNGRLYLAWTGADGHLNVISSADGVKFTNKVTLGDTSNVGPTLAGFNGRLYLGWTGLDGHLNVESSADGMSFSNKVTLGDTSLLSTPTPGKFQDLSPALATFGGRLYLAWTGADTHLNVESSANGTSFSNKVTLSNATSANAPALTVEQPTVQGRPSLLVLGWTNVGPAAPQIHTMTSTDGQTFGGLVTSTQTATGSVALSSSSAGTLDIAWTGFNTGPKDLNFMQV
jgi:hypothetical protein